MICENYHIHKQIKGVNCENYLKHKQIKGVNCENYPKHKQIKGVNCENYPIHKQIKSVNCENYPKPKQIKGTYNNNSYSYQYRPWVMLGMDQVGWDLLVLLTPCARAISRCQRDTIQGP